MRFQCESCGKFTTTFSTKCTYERCYTLKTGERDLRRAMGWAVIVPKAGRKGRPQQVSQVYARQQDAEECMKRALPHFPGAVVQRMFRKTRIRVLNGGKAWASSRLPNY